MLDRIRSLSLLSGMTSAAPSAPHPALAALLDGEQWGGTPPAAGSEGEAAASSSAALEGAASSIQQRASRVMPRNGQRGFPL